MTQKNEERDDIVPLQEANQPNKKFCFIIMPSGNHDEYGGGSSEADFVYDGIIRVALKAAFPEGIEVVRETDNFQTGAITKSILRNLAKADIVIVDITGHNANVFFELGVRYSLKKSSTILLRQKNTFIPFDIGNYRCIQYSPVYFGLKKAIDDLTEVLKETKKANAETVVDSLVYDIFPNLTVETENTNPIINSRIMPWEVYWEKLKLISSNLKANSTFKPDVIIGISNGGMVFADLLIMTTYFNNSMNHSSNVPVWSLWANRREQSDTIMFQSAPNIKLFEGIRELKKSTTKNEYIILVVDDNVASGNSSTAALRFIEEIFKDDKSIKPLFLPLFSRGINNSYYKIEKYIVWKHPSFGANYTDSSIQKLHNTTYSFFPYDKELRAQ